MYISTTRTNTKTNVFGACVCVWTKLTDRRVCRAGAADDCDGGASTRGHVAAQRVRLAQPTLLLPQRQVPLGDAGPGYYHVAGYKFKASSC